MKSLLESVRSPLRLFNYTIVSKEALDNIRITECGCVPRKPDDKKRGRLGLTCLHLHCCGSSVFPVQSSPAAVALWELCVSGTVFTCCCGTVGTLCFRYSLHLLLWHCGNSVFPVQSSPAAMALWELCVSGTVFTCCCGTVGALCFRSCATLS
ncbi:hypothetical protein STEG23_000132 [Scotinomys teguina]